MYTIKGTVKNGVIHPLESVELPEGKSVMIVVTEENQEDKSVQSKLKLSELLLLPELEEDDPLFERNQDTGRDIIL
jgi:predicted DNA-binding antitoxin AbrB/MazE fold protein